MLTVQLPLFTNVSCVSDPGRQRADVTTEAVNRERDTHGMFESISGLKVHYAQKTEYNTDFTAYSDTVYSDAPLTVTLLACPK